MQTDSDLWAAIEAAGPVALDAGFDPLLVDNVLAVERSAAQHDRRRAFVAAYAWAVPTREAVGRIAEFASERQVLEVCAGSGLWAKLLSEQGARVIATDAAQIAAAWYSVQQLEAAAAVRAHPQCPVLLLCWPPFRKDCAYRALQEFRGDRLVFIGDANFTAEAAFHATLASQWALVDSLPLPSWPGTHDGVHLYHRA